MREVISDELKKLLSLPLPGREAQWLMAPLNRRAREVEALRTEGARESAVLLLINPFTEIPSFFLIERQGYDGPHSGQIGLPGGKKEATDADFWHTAIRETTEELGISADSIEPLGMLTELFIPVSRFWVFPKIGILKNEVALSPDAREVKRVIAPFISEVLKEENRARRSVSAGGFQLEAPVFIFNDIQVWGATAMILSEFSEVLKQSDLIRYYS